MFRTDADPLILNRDPDPPVTLYLTIICRLFVFSLEKNRTTVGHGLIGIDHKIADHLADLTDVDFSRPEVVGYAAFAADIGTTQDKLGRIPDNLFQ